MKSRWLFELCSLALCTALIVVVKKVLDAVSLHLLVDDNMRRCQVHHISAFGDDAWTQIRVVPANGGDKTLLKRVETDMEKT